MSSNQNNNGIYHRLKLQYPKTCFALKCIGIGSSILVFRSLYHRYKSKYYKLPPGPKGLPFIGCLYQFLYHPREFLIEISKYGSIVSVPLGLRMITFINDTKTWQCMMKHHQFTINGRPNYSNKWSIDPGLCHLNGKDYQTRLSLWSSSFATIFNEPFIAKKIETALYQNRIIKKLDKYTETREDWMCNKDLRVIIFNALFASCFGITIKGNDDFVLDFLRLNDERMKAMDFQRLWLLCGNIKIPEFIMYRYLNGLKNINNEQVKLLIDWMLAKGGFDYDINEGLLKRNRHHPNNHKRNKMDNVKYLIDVMIKYNNEQIKKIKHHPMHNKKKKKKKKKREEVKKESEEKQSEEFSVISLDSMIMDVITMISKGLDTTVNVVQSALILLMKYPKIQERIYDELKRVIILENKKVIFSMDLLKECHVFRAFVSEVLRIANVMPLDQMHCNGADGEYKDDETGYMIPKQGVVIPNVSAMHAQEFGDDDQIHLDRWLDDKGKFKQNEKMMAFGAGDRGCVGKKLALNMVYNVIAVLLMRYRVYSEDVDIKTEQKWGWIQRIVNEIGIKLIKRKSVIDIYNERFKSEIQRSMSLEDGVYFIYTFQGETEQKLLIDVAANSKKNNMNIHQWKYHGGLNQQFKLELDDEKNGYYTMQSIKSGSRAQLKYESKIEGAELVQYEECEDKNKKAQKWILICVDEKEKIYKIMNANSLLYLGTQGNSQKLHSNKCIINSL